MRIERVEPSKHKKNRILVFLEGGQLLKITENELLRYDLRPDGELTEELLERNPAPDKATQQFAWIQHMNMLKAQAEEIIVAELIYS